jgi:hypothetical protein
MMRISIIGIQRDGPLEVFFRAGKIPIELKPNVCESRASFDRFIVYA